MFYAKLTASLFLLLAVPYFAGAFVFKLAFEIDGNQLNGIAMMMLVSFALVFIGLGVLIFNQTLIISRLDSLPKPIR